MARLSLSISPEQKKALVKALKRAAKGTPCGKWKPLIRTQLRSKPVCPHCGGTFSYPSHIKGQRFCEFAHGCGKPFWCDVFYSTRKIRKGKQ